MTKSKLVREAQRIAEAEGLTVAEVIGGAKHIRLACKHEGRPVGYLSIHLGSRVTGRHVAAWRSDARSMARGTYHPGGVGCQ